jgi:release factor glutamine methyltransferase
MTVLEAIQRSGEFLGRKGVESPRLQAELLLAHVLKLKRMQLYLSFERSLSEAETAQYRDSIQRRGEREPLQHIIGSTNFCGLEIAVNRHVLVPRPETELLAEQGWMFLNTIDAKAGRPPRALDLGTGSGCIAIALAARCATAELTAIDKSTEALNVARKNADARGVIDRIQFLHGDAFAALENDRRFDLIISNPPYIPSAEIATLQPEVRDFDPTAALDGGADGLAFFQLIGEAGRSFLDPAGKCMVEFGDGQAAAVKKIFLEQKWIVDAVIEDYTRRPRIMIASATA